MLDTLITFTFNILTWKVAVKRSVCLDRKYWIVKYSQHYSWTQNTIKVCWELLVSYCTDSCLVLHSPWSPRELHVDIPFNPLYTVCTIVITMRPCRHLQATDNYY